MENNLSALKAQALKHLENDRVGDAILLFNNKLNYDSDIFMPFSLLKRQYFNLLEMDFSVRLSNLHHTTNKAHIVKLTKAFWTPWKKGI